jgi:ABC-type nickel/cobalt efflux system permease component RcnA
MTGAFAAAVVAVAVHPLGTFTVDHTVGQTVGQTVGHDLSGADVLNWHTEVLTDRLTSLVGADRLTLPLGMLALLVSLVLGAVHAALPGHGKTVMAAYLAGRGGRPRDALAAAAAVTVTHTAGVLVLGVLLTVTTSVTGDVVVGWLSVASGAIVAAIGVTLLFSAVRLLVRERHAAPAHGLTHGSGLRRAGLGRSRGVLALGVAGGLVPSPSALVVLLGAMALGRTALGIATVVCYGLGMTVTLLTTALALRRLRNLAIPRRLIPLRPYTSTMTAALVLLVGTGVTVRAMTSLI